MHLILRYRNGRRADALLVTRGATGMRVILRGRNETLELKHILGNWLTEYGERVSIEAIIADPHQGGRQTNTKYSTTAETTNTATAAMRSSSAGGMN